MNFLAHCLLARPGDGYLAGAVLGDFVKGPVPRHLPTELQAGIRLHRRIDSHSNHLLEMKTSVARFDPALRRVAPVLLDIVADHCLALRWRRFSDLDLAAFTAEIYAALARFEDCVPERGRRFVDYMVETDLLARYGDWSVALRAMKHVLERLRLQHLAPLLGPQLTERLPSFIDDCAVYLPLLQTFADAEREVIEADLAAISPP